MQIVIDIMARPSLKESLREIIISDLKKWEYGLDVLFEKKIGRRSGWAKINGQDLTGVINIYWHATSKTLIARAVGKRGNKPCKLVGRFIAYLLEHRRRDIIGVSLRTL